MLMERIKVGIIGGAGYTGGELIRLLVNHPKTEISFIHSRSHSNTNVGLVHGDLVGDIDLQFVGSIPENWNNIQVLFLCVGHGEAKKFLDEHQVPDDVRIIDLSQDFRLVQNKEYSMLEIQHAYLFMDYLNLIKSK
jgi:N-acetyl-gamma-glutamyl-phosphate reductase